LVLDCDPMSTMISSPKNDALAISPSRFKPRSKLGVIRIMESLPPQVRHSRIHLPRFERIQNEQDGWGPISVKPAGGMWTSSYTPDNPEGLCDWLRWCVGEHFREWQWR
jgi:hypothetical protein